MIKEMSELGYAFNEWADGQTVWIPSDTRLAEAIAAVLGVDLAWSNEAER